MNSIKIETLIRLSKSEDLPSLHKVWEDVFASPDKDLFFDYFYKPERCVVAQVENKVCAMGFILPVGDFVCNGSSYPCAMIYALATLPQYRNYGIGSALVSKLVLQGQKSGYPVTILCPSSDDVFNYYSSKTEFKDRFYIDEKIYSNLPATSSSNTHLSDLSAKEYLNLRNYKLAKRTHIEFELSVIEYQKKLCRLTGGDLYKIDGNGWIGVLAVEKLSDENIIVNELLCPQECENEVISAISAIFPGCEITVRTPVSFDPNFRENARRFGMMTSCIPEVNDLKLNVAWYGFAFD